MRTGAASGSRAVWLPLLAVALLWPASAAAQGPPINTQNAFVTGLNGGAIRTFFFTFDRSGLALDGRGIADPLGRRVRVWGQAFVLPYELLPNRLVVMAMIPYLNKRLEMGPPTDRRSLGVDGFGDLAVAAKLRVYQKDGPNRTTRVALFGRLKLPTGRTDATGPDGALLPRSLQLGSGSVDASLGVIVTRSVGPLGLSGDLIYDINTADGGFAFGDVLRYDVALGFRILPRVYRTYPARQINLYLEANGWHGRHDTLAGVSLVDSGGDLLLLSPGIQYIPLANFLLEASYQMPVWQRLDGAQLEFDPTFKVGLRWLIF